jgi:hypothetical protein
LTSRVKQLEYLTIVWNSLEGLVAVTTGVLADSISLVGFGIESYVEVASGVALLEQMAVDKDEIQGERNEPFALRIVGARFLALSM